MTTELHDRNDGPNKGENNIRTKIQYSIPIIKSMVHKTIEDTLDFLEEEQLIYEPEELENVITNALFTIRTLDVHKHHYRFMQESCFSDTLDPQIIIPEHYFELCCEINAIYEQTYGDSETQRLNRFREQTRTIHEKVLLSIDENENTKIYEEYCQNMQDIEFISNNPKAVYYTLDTFFIDNPNFLKSSPCIKQDYESFVTIQDIKMLGLKEVATGTKFIVDDIMKYQTKAQIKLVGKLLECNKIRVQSYKINNSEYLQARNLGREITLELIRLTHRQNAGLETKIKFNPLDERDRTWFVNGITQIATHYIGIPQEASRDFNTIIRHYWDEIAREHLHTLNFGKPFLVRAMTYLPWKYHRIVERKKYDLEERRISHLEENRTENK